MANTFQRQFRLNGLQAVHDFHDRPVGGGGYRIPLRGEAFFFVSLFFVFFGYPLQNQHIPPKGKSSNHRLKKRTLKRGYLSC